MALHEVPAEAIDQAHGALEVDAVTGRHVAEACPPPRRRSARRPTTPSGPSSKATTVRQQPLTAIDAPISTSSRTVEQAIRKRLLSRPATVPISSTIPVKQFAGLLDCQARAEAALDFHFNASLATLNLVRAADLCMQQGQAPHVFSMASWKQCQFNERLLDLFMEKFALDPTVVKNHACYDELRTYGAIAA